MLPCSGHHFFTTGLRTFLGLVLRVMHTSLGTSIQFSTLTSLGRTTILSLQTSTFFILQSSLGTSFTVCEKKMQKLIFAEFFPFCISAKMGKKEILLKKSKEKINYKKNRYKKYCVFVQKFFHAKNCLLVQLCPLLQF